MRAPEARLAALILAAGASTRLGRPKQLLQVDGEALLRRVARAALSTRPVRTVVVVGAGGDAVVSALAGLDVEPLHCADWREGMAASLRIGVGALGADCDGLLVLLTDQPAVTPAYLGQLVAAWRRAPTRAVASGYAGAAGVPAILPRSWFAELQGLRGDTGARALLRTRPEQVTVVPAPELAADIDSPADFGG